MAATRRLAREIALKTLYQVAIGGVSVSDALDAVLEEQARVEALESDAPEIPDRREELAREAMHEYARGLVTGVMSNGEEYDEILARYAREWDPNRMPTVDHILLHIALHEIKESDDVPHGVAINEAVELAKVYSTEESPKFINGILGKYVRTEGPEAPGT